MNEKMNKYDYLYFGCEDDEDVKIMAGHIVAQGDEAELDEGAIRDARRRLEARQN